MTPTLPSSEETPSFLAPRRKQLLLGSSRHRREHGLDGRDHRRTPRAPSIWRPAARPCATSFQPARDVAVVRRRSPTTRSVPVGLGLLINIKVFLIAEVFILIFALVPRVDPDVQVAGADAVSHPGHGLHRRVPWHSRAAGLPLDRLRRARTEVPLHLVSSPSRSTAASRSSSPTARTSRRSCAPASSPYPTGNSSPLVRSGSRTRPRCDASSCPRPCAPSSHHC